MNYIGAPYTHEDPALREWRAGQAGELCAFMTARKKLAYSPITHGHAIYQAAIRRAERVPVEYAFWQQHSIWMLRNATSLIVLCLDGWRESVGLIDEQHAAKALAMPIWYVVVHPSTDPAKPGRNYEYRGTIPPQKDDLQCLIK